MADDRLPPVRGRIIADAPLAPHTWFRVGGPAEVLFRPADAEDLIDFFKKCPSDIPVTVIGMASNLLVRDGGVPGVVIKLGRGFSEVKIEHITPHPDASALPGFGMPTSPSRGEVAPVAAFLLTPELKENFDISSPLPLRERSRGNSRAGEGYHIHCQAGALDLTVAQTAAEHGIGGLEFLSGIPGTIGGAVRMNAGAYGREMVNVLVEATAVDHQGRIHKIEPTMLHYRHSTFPEDWIVVEAVLQGRADDPAVIAQRMADIQRQREESQPVRARTGGSTFANPPGHKAWQLIDKAGCRGLRHGDAQVSEKHCNFLLNLGQATAADLEALGEDVRQRVLKNSGVDLRWEIKRIGVKPNSNKKV